MRSCTPQKQPPARTARSLFMATVHLAKVGNIALGLHVVTMNEAHCRRVDAIAQPAMVARTIVKYVTQVAVAVCGAHLRVRAVRQLLHVGRVDRPGEAGPAAA